MARTPRISVASTEFVHVAISTTNFDTGLPVSLAGLAVELAFIIGDATPVPADFETAGWNLAGTKARVLVGPAGGVALAVGTYKVWWKIVDSPEIPVQLAPGFLEVF